MYGKVVLIGLSLMMFTPFLLLIEAGATGALGFKGRWRYVGLTLLILVVITLAASLVYLFLLRMRQGAWR